MKSVCGLDVHKDSVYLCILSEFGELIEKVFGVLTYQLEEMRDLMLHHHVVEVSMESTSVYWIPIWRVLSPHFKLNLANPYFIKQLPGRKSDVKDAQWIAECTMKELIRGSFVPPLYAAASYLLRQSNSCVSTTAVYSTSTRRYKKAVKT